MFYNTGDGNVQWGTQEGGTLLSADSSVGDLWSTGL